MAASAYRTYITSSNQQFDKLKAWNLDTRVKSRLEGTGFDTYVKYAEITVLHDFSILNALLACYRDGSFNFGENKLVIGLEDVLRITGLPIDGKAFIGSTLDCKQLALDIFGIVEEDKTSCRLSWLKDNFEVVPAHIDQNSEEIRKYVIAFMLFVLGTTIIPGKTRDKVWLMYLHVLKDLENVKTYAIGAAVLAHLHDELDAMEKSKACYKRFNGDAAFLVVAAMEYVPQLACKLMENDDIQKPMTFPLLLGWGQLYKERLARKYKADTEDYIHVLENLKEVTWQPYSRLDNDFLPVELKDQLVMRFSRTVMICFNTVAYHRPDMCIKKFGFSKICTSGCRKVKRYRSKSLKGPMKTDLSSRKYAEEWEQRKNSLIKCADVKLDEKREETGLQSDEYSHHIEEHTSQSTNKRKRKMEQEQGEETELNSREMPDGLVGTPYAMVDEDNRIEDPIPHMLSNDRVVDCGDPQSNEHSAPSQLGRRVHDDEIVEERQGTQCVEWMWNDVDAEQSAPSESRLQVHDDEDAEQPGPVVLSNKFISESIKDASGLRRKRKVPSTLGIWKLNNRIIKEQVFCQPLLTGLCSELCNICSETYISTRLRSVEAGETGSSSLLEQPISSSSSSSTSSQGSADSVTYNDFYKAFTGRAAS